ncbi:MAG: glucose sorbosone dehydrogenase [Chlorobiaceae bacterium]|nr:glucose sorbosone dehydrogenase [Chlorobiaceae bacterium]
MRMINCYGRSVSVVIFVMLFIFSHQSKSQSFSIEQAFPNLNFSWPVDFQSPNDGTNRIFVVAQGGIIWVFPNQKQVATAKQFLNISDRLTFGGEEGLLGLAFHPNYSQNGFFYVYYSAPSPRRSVISRFTVSQSNPDSAIKSSEFIILQFNQPFANHNGGQITFGRDGFLYIATGDGGSAGDPQNNSQNRGNLLGKILRIDVDRTRMGINYSIPVDNPFVNNTQNWSEEIYAWGLRNPWRFSFDPVTNFLWTGDVGQSKWEEISIIEKGKNYGWRIMEGFECFNPPSNCDTSGLTLPIFVYGHNAAGGYSITGGFVYRGRDVPELVGKYIYGDYVSRRIWALTYDGINPTRNEVVLNNSGFGISSFGVDQNNELYILGFDGKVWKFRPTTSDIKDETSINNFYLHQNYPNPFNATTKIKFSIPSASRSVESIHVSLKIYDALGNEVAILVNETKQAGNYEVEFNADKLSSGLYLYKLSSNNFFETKKMILLK